MIDDDTILNDARAQYTSTQNFVQSTMDLLTHYGRIAEAPETQLACRQMHNACSSAYARMKMPIQNHSVYLVDEALDFADGDTDDLEIVYDLVDLVYTLEHCIQLLLVTQDDDTIELITNILSDIRNRE